MYVLFVDWQTADLMGELHGLKISHATVSNYANAAILVKPHDEHSLNLK